MICEVTEVEIEVEVDVAVTEIKLRYVKQIEDMQNRGCQISQTLKQLENAIRKLRET